MKTRAISTLKFLLIFIAVFHLFAGFGLMFSSGFQKFAASTYGALVDWGPREIYLVRVLGSFAFVLGFLAWMAARDPIKHRIVVIGFIEFFVLRNIHRHLYADELNAGFGIGPRINALTSVFFAIQAIALGAALYYALKEPTRAT